MKNKKRILPFGIILGVIAVCAVVILATAGIMSAKGYGVSVGRLYLSGTEFYLTDEGETMIMSDQSAAKSLFDGFNTGDLIFVIHNGMDESYPSRTGAYRAFRISKGDENDLPENLDIGVVKRTEKAEFLNTSSIDFDAQYIRTDGYREGTRYPIVKIIRSKQELNTYYESNKGKYNLERRGNANSDTAMGFLDACDKYDENYFEKHILIMVLLEEGSGSNRHKVRTVNIDSTGQCSINIDRIVPEVGTCDMAQWHILIEPKTEVKIEKESDITVSFGGANALTKPDLVRHSRGYANISLNIPDGWEYEIEERDETNEFCIVFWPARRSDGKIKVCYYDFFGVCGTGLEQEKIRLGKYEAYKGTYAHDNLWYFINLINTAGDYVIINDGADAWWDEYGNEAMQILSTVVVGEGFIGEDEAIAIAIEEFAEGYDQAFASYDSGTGLWTVSFYRGGSSVSSQKIMVTCDGKIADAKY